MGKYNSKKDGEMTLKQSLLIDKRINSKVSFIILSLYRVQHILYARKHFVLLRIFGWVKNVVYFVFGVDAQISYKAILGNYIRLPHRAMGVVISPKAIIGDHVTIFHHVTIGINERKPKELQQIVIEDNCYLSAGCCVISCKVSKNCKIAPNTVVYKDVPANSLVYTVTEMKISNPYDQ